MSGGTLRRRFLMIGLISVLWLFPLANANAAPRGGAKGSVSQIQEFGRILLRSIETFFRSLAMPGSMPPGQQPGSSGPGEGTRDGIGIDPNGGGRGN